MNEFKDKVVIITGASSGIGYELTRQLAQQGAWLALAARRAEPLQQLAEECRELSGRAEVVVTDVGIETQCQRLVERTIAAYGRIDVLVNNAGITMRARFEDMRVLAPFETVMRVNYLGSVFCTHYALPYLKQSKGHIVTVSSLAGKTGVPFRSGYSASKFALAGFFETLRIELSEYGVSVTMVYPDYVQTETRLQALGPDGNPLGNRPLREGRMMTVQAAAAQIVLAMGARKRELVMSTRGKLGQWLKLIAPGIVDRIAARAVQG